MPLKQAPQQLPPKEHNLFKSVVRFYETKQLKKALKSADAILKRFPDHGETLAMKGLTLNALDKKTEANELVRKGLRLHMTSHICWHVYGLLYRSQRDYREAAKAYLHALKYDKDNQQILRDLALLQVQIRDYDGLEDTRRRLLTVRPNQRNNWIGFALSYHLLGNYSTAVSILDTYQQTLRQSTEKEDPYEVSELLLYKNMILEESGQHEAALSHLDQNIHRIVDRFALRETRARLLFALANFQLAAAEIRSLLAVNPDNHIYIRALQACQIRAVYPDSVPNGFDPAAITPSTEPYSFERAFGLAKAATIQNRTFGPLDPIHSDDHVDVALQVCDELIDKYSYSRAAPRIALDVLPSGHHPQFLPRADSYVRPFLRKGIPSLFSDVKSLYGDKSKSDVFGTLFQSYRRSLENKENARLPPVTPIPGRDSHSAGRADEGWEEESPCTLLWVLHFLAQHYDRLGQRELALETIQQAIDHTPTAIECYLVKARILKHYGDLTGAVAVADEARNMDLADRYLNTKCSKYGLRADRISEAETWIGLFTRDGDSGGPQALYDMQCMWFELGAAESHLRQGQIPQALKKFVAVERHFADMVEDQFDFHSYCLRKVTLRAYVSVLRFEDRIRSHPYYARTASGIVRCLLRLYDMPERDRLVYVGEHADIVGFADMTDAERKKAISKRKKQLAKRMAHHGSGGGRGHGKGSGKGFGKGKLQGGGKGGGKGQANGGVHGQANANETSGNQTASENKQKANAGWMDSDTRGGEYVKNLFEKKANGEFLLEEAGRVLRECERHLRGSMGTHALALEVALRRKKYLMALRAVRAARRVDGEDSVTLMMALKLSAAVEEEGVTESFSEVVRCVFEKEGFNILGGKSRVEFVEEYIERNVKHAERRIGGLRAMMWLARNREDGAGRVEKRCEALAVGISQCDGDGAGESTLSAKVCKRMLDEMKEEGYGEEVLSRLCESVGKIHGRASFV